MRGRFSQLTTAAVLVVGFWRWGGDYWHTKWAVALALASIGIGWEVARRSTWSAGAAFTYTALSSLYVFAWRDTYVAGLGQLASTAMDAATAYTFAAFLVLAAAAAVTAGRPARQALGWACVADSALVVVQAVAHGFRYGGQGGFFDEGPVNGTFIAVTFPFLFEVTRGLPPAARNAAAGVAVAALCANAVLDQGSNVVGVGLVVFATAVVLRGSDREDRWWRALFAFIMGAAGLAVFLVLNPNLFAGGSGRFVMYGHAMRFLLGQGPAHWLFGMGNGSFLLLGPEIQRAAGLGAPGQWFLWLHSDWLQLVFEMGAVGLAVYLWLAWDAVRAARDRGDWPLAAALLGFAASAVFQYPVHLPLFAFTGIALVATAVLPLERA
jgi:hypothetical protein